MSNIPTKYYRYTIEEDTNFNDLVSDKYSLFKNYTNRKSDFLNITEDKFEPKLTNLKRIWNNYTDAQQKEYLSDYNTGSLSIINLGTELLIPETEALIELSIISSKNLYLEQGSFQAFYANAFKTINNDPLNVPAVKELDQKKLTVAQLKNYNISIWIYIKALDKILDVSQFVESVNTTSAIQGGTFNISMSGFDDINNIISEGNELTSIYKMEDRSTGTLPIAYFTRYLQHKDVVFIKFEKLALEKGRTGKIIDSFEIAKNNLSGQVYDMIGLIDQVNESATASSLEKQVTITGNDLNVMLADDANYFYPVMFVQDSDLLMFNTQDRSRLAKRNFITGDFENYFTFSLYKIKDAIGFIFNQLSNLGVVPNDLFQGYSVNNKEENEIGERRTQAIRIQGDSDYINYSEVNGIWQIIDLLVEDNLGDRRQANSLLVKSSGTLLEQVNSICQDPFVEFMGDTYGDKFTFIARQKPFTQYSILNYLNDNNIVEIGLEDVLSYNFNWETEFYTWYQIEANSDFLGYDKYTSLAYIPIIFLPTIADYFGNHRYMISDSYISSRALAGDKKDIDNNKFREAVINDLIYVISSTIYLPFTRSGNIILNGDRRLKKGTWCRFKPTGEVFYINSVNNSFNASRNMVDRTTSISVSRGMVEKYINGELEQVNDDYKFISYFNIVNIDVIKKTLIKTLTQEKVTTKTSNITTKANFDVNTDVFNFFIQRRQF